MKLIKDINESIRPKDEFELALEEFDNADKEKEQEQTDSMDSPSDEIERIINHWKGKTKDMSEDQLRDAVGNDLEKLEYSPEEVEQYVPEIMKGLGFEK